MQICRGFEARIDKDQLEIQTINNKKTKSIFINSVQKVLQFLNWSYFIIIML